MRPQWQWQVRITASLGHQGWAPKAMYQNLFPLTASSAENAAAAKAPCNSQNRTVAQAAPPISRKEPLQNKVLQEVARQSQIRTIRAKIKYGFSPICPLWLLHWNVPASQRVLSLALYVCLAGTFCTERRTQRNLQQRKYTCSEEMCQRTCAENLLRETSAEKIKPRNLHSEPTQSNLPRA